MAREENKCLICGKSISEGIVCEECKTKVTEELCQKVATFNYFNPDNDLWASIAEKLESSYKFREYSLELADYINEDRRVYVKLLCLNLMNNKKIDSLRRYIAFILENADSCINTQNINDEEKNFILALKLYAFIFGRRWKEAEELSHHIKYDKKFFEPYSIMANYYMKLRDYKKALEILDEAKKLFPDFKERIDDELQDITSRSKGEKKGFIPQGTENAAPFYEFLDSLGIPHESLGNSRKNKVKEKDFKPYTRYDNDNAIPNDYVAFWLTSEFHVKADEVVEISALKICDGKIKDKYHSYVKPVNIVKNPKFVSEEILKNSKPIDGVFSEFLSFVDGNILANLGFGKQGKLLGRLARYSAMDEIKNIIFDVIEYAEDNSDDFETLTSESLLKKYNLKDEVSGEKKAELTYKLIEKMRKNGTK